jgi:hypothetical protein
MNEENSKTLSESMRRLRATADELAAQMRKVSEAGQRSRTAAAACIGGACGAASTSTNSSSPQRSAGSAPVIPAAAVRAAFSGDWRGALQGVMSSLIRNLTAQISRSMGGGLGSSLLTPLIGGGLSMLLGRLFRKKQQVVVDNTVKAEVLNFPRLSSLDFASNPASRLFSGRAVPRGPAFVVQVDYRGGAEDLVSAKVAARLADINFHQGIK